MEVGGGSALRVFVTVVPEDGHASPSRPRTRGLSPQSLCAGPQPRDPMAVRLSLEALGTALAWAASASPVLSGGGWGHSLQCSEPSNCWPIYRPLVLEPGWAVRGPVPPGVVAVAPACLGQAQAPPARGRASKQGTRDAACGRVPGPWCTRGRRGLRPGQGRERERGGRRPAGAQGPAQEARCSFLAKCSLGSGGLAG